MLPSMEQPQLWPPLETAMLFLSAARNELLTVVQVGANDGITNDPVHGLFAQFASTVVLIEPQPELIPRLRANYANFGGRVVIEQCAVAAEPSSLELFMLQPHVAESYHRQTGFNPTGIVSFSKTHLEQHLVKHQIVEPHQLADAVSSFQVAARPLESILGAHGFTTIDFLQIDAEGADWNILKTAGRFLPSVINIEWVHLSDLDKRECLAWAEINHYRTLIHERECLFVRDVSKCREE
jgi:FkbM family methyltransferase